MQIKWNLYGCGRASQSTLREMDDRRFRAQAADEAVDKDESRSAPPVLHSSQRSLHTVMKTSYGCPLGFTISVGT